MIDSPWLAAWLVVAVLAAVQTVLLSVYVWEHRRFARRRLSSLPRHVPSFRPYVALFAPCKGYDLELGHNLRPLFEQDYERYELVFIVESADDPAVAVIEELRASFPGRKARLIIAGHSERCGQKVHNLLAATQRLAPQIEVLAFVDSDARPRRDWLRHLVSRLNRPNIGAATGYRWFVPLRPSLANYVLYSLNAAAASLLGTGGHHLVWGGSWAVRRDVFEHCNLRRAWMGTLSDDLVAARVLHAAGLQVRFEPACVMASPLDHTWRETARFVNRQYTIGRCYAPLRWALACYGAAVEVLAVWGALVIAAAQVLGGGGVWYLPLIVAGFQYGWSFYRGLLRRELAGLYLRGEHPYVKRAALFDACLAPLITLLHLAWLARSLCTRRLTWRGITYRLCQGGRAEVVARRPFAAQPAARNGNGGTRLVPEAPQPVVATSASAAG
jgi:hypothetical protein